MTGVVGALAVYLIGGADRRGLVGAPAGASALVALYLYCW